MDWFSWLSKTGLEPSLIYEYGLAFSRNELQAEDLTYFDHEFLQSMGISVAKHRLEILKVAKKEIVQSPKNGISKLVLAINKTRKTIKKYIHKLVVFDREDLAIQAVTEQPSDRGTWGVATNTKGKSEGDAKKPPLIRARSKQTKSGPLDRRYQEKMMAAERSLKLSGPLNGNLLQEKLVSEYRSPKLTGALDGKLLYKSIVSCRSPQVATSPWDAKSPSPKLYNSKEENNVNGKSDEHALWSALFQDMKPT
ncbi:hypothetical protein K2173_017815 [Erythroxylum novogranatense]|uniref:SAM domain-containing protein n=1 Tax=Erythroxylum novogranatense TaxID=1862640 RepID=A0AAV8SME2_9ROSI|nr:hypothetical protein K2173_017815 [Erythroxylum novogranatense]